MRIQTKFHHETFFVLFSGYPGQDYHLTIVVHFPETNTSASEYLAVTIVYDRLGLTSDIHQRSGDDTDHHPRAAMIQARELDKVANPGHDNTVNLMFYTGG